VEFHDPTLIAADTVKFARWIENEYFPVIDMIDTAGIFQEANRLSSFVEMVVFAANAYHSLDDAS
jgi:hypothetical protein